MILDEIAAARAAPAPVTAHDVLRILRRHVALVIFTFAAVVAATLFFTSKMPRVYEANTSVLLDSVAPANLGASGLIDLLAGGSTGTPMDTEIEKIRSRDFLNEVIARGKLKETNPDDLRGRLTLNPGAGNQILAVSMRGKTPSDAVEGANWTARVYMDRTGRDFDAKTELSKTRLHRAEARALAEKKNAEKILNAFMARMGTSDPAVYFNSQTAKTMDVGTYTNASLPVAYGENGDALGHPAGTNAQVYFGRFDVAATSKVKIAIEGTIRRQKDESTPAPKSDRVGLYASYALRRDAFIGARFEHVRTQNDAVTTTIGTGNRAEINAGIGF